MLIMRMDTAVTEQPHDMKFTVIALDMLHRLKQHFIFEEIAVFNRLVDACEALIHDAAGTDIQMADLRIPHLSFRQTDIQAGRRQFVMRIMIEITVEVRFIRRFYRIAFRFFTVGKPIQYDQSCRFGHYLAPSSNSRKESASRDAPPTSAPSICSRPIYSLMFAGFTEPPYWTRTLSATSSLYNAAIFLRAVPHISFASSLVADFPVPIAQIGSYAMTTFSTSSADTSRSAFSTWLSTRSICLPASRSASVSPTQTIGTMLFFKVASVFLFTVASVSLKCSRRSEWPMMI